MPLTMEDAFKQLEQMEKLKLNQSENDYDRLVPKEVHNNICYDEARRNIKSLEQSMKPVKLLLKNCMNIGSEAAAEKSA